MVFRVGQHVLVFGSITLQSLHCPLAIEKEQYSPDEQPVWYSTSHLSVRVMGLELGLGLGLGLGL